MEKSDWNCWKKIYIKYVIDGYYDKKSDIMENNTILDYENLWKSKSLSTLSFVFMALKKDAVNYAEFMEIGVVKGKYLVNGQGYFVDNIMLSPSGIYDEKYTFIEDTISTISKSEIS